MKILNHYKQLFPSKKTIALTIGNFDGVHLGHQALLNRLKHLAEQAVAITFSNHPSEILHQSPKSYLITLEHRLALIEQSGIDDVILIPFSDDFSKQTAADFLSSLRKAIPFTHLILGHDAVIGHDRNKHLYEIAEQLHFNIEYLKPICFYEKIISSSEIRKSILAGNLLEASQFLGRPYSIFGSVKQGARKGRSLGFPTANLGVDSLVLPPFGVYAVEVRIGNELFPAVANLGHAPTLHQSRSTYLEVHLINYQRDLYNQQLDVIFLNYLRPEMKFESINALKYQIQVDIEKTKEFFKIH